MANVAVRGERSQAVREFLAQHPEASTKDVVAAMQEKGLQISEALASKIKYAKPAKKSGAKGRGRLKSGTAGDLERGARSRAIREYLAQNPAATAKDIIPALREQGIEVNEGLISNIKYGKKGKASSGQLVSVAAIRSTSGRNGTAPVGPNGITARELFEAKRLVDVLGGIEQAKRALATLEELR